MSLHSKRVVVVGGGSGIGLAVATLALDAGANVVIAGRSMERLRDAAVQLEESRSDASIGALRRGSVSTASLDARHEAALASFMAAHAPIDHLVITVGPGAPRLRYTSFLEQPTGDAHALFDNKFWAQYLCAKHAAPHLSVDGSITLFGGAAGRRPIASMAVLAAVQAAIEGLARGMALDLAPVRVNVVAPGRIASSSFADMPPAERTAMLAQWAASLPVGRIGMPEDAAAAAIYLMTNRYTTGNVLYVDGGHYLV